MSYESHGDAERIGFFVDAEYEKYFPPSFREDPFSFFENFGVNVKEGIKSVDNAGRLREDPTAVKDIDLESSAGEHLGIVGKRVNLEKGKIAESGNPLHEFHVMTRVLEAGLPVARPLAYATRDGEYLLFMERVDGVRFTDIAKLLKTVEQQYGYSVSDMANIQNQLEDIMRTMQKDFEKAGIRRNWSLKDMVADIDFENKVVKSVTPVDWERTKLIG